MLSTVEDEDVVPSTRPIKRKHKHVDSPVKRREKENSQGKGKRGTSTSSTTVSRKRGPNGVQRNLTPKKKPTGEEERVEGRGKRKRKSKTLAVASKNAPVVPGKVKSIVKDTGDDFFIDQKAEFQWRESPQFLRTIVKNLIGVLPYCIFEIHDPPMDGSEDGNKPFIHVLGVDSFHTAAVDMHYVPQKLFKYVKGIIRLKVDLTRLKKWLMKKVLLNGYSMTLRRYVDKEDYLQAVFQRGATIRRRTLVLDKIQEADDLQDHVFGERWRISIPLKLFKCEMQSALESSDTANASSKSKGSKKSDMLRGIKVRFEVRRDPRTGETYFGIIQEGTDDDVWLPAPMEQVREGQDFIEFGVSEDGDMPQIPDELALGKMKPSADLMAAYKNMYRTNFAKMQPVFNMVFSASYLYKFVENMDHTDNVNHVTLVFSPDAPDDDGVMQPQPVTIKHNLGKLPFPLHAVPSR